MIPPGSLSALFVTMRFKLACSVIFLVFNALVVAGIQGQAPRKNPWTTSRVQGTPDPPPPFTIEQVDADVMLDEPTEMIRVPGTDRWIVTEVNGTNSFVFQRVGS